MTNKLQKIMRLAKAGATPGERTAAIEALKRLDVPLAIEPVKDTMTLIALTMVTPTTECIYAPSHILPSVTIPRSKLGQPWKSMLVSFEPDGKSNPKRTKVYAVGTAGYYCLPGGEYE